MTQTSPIFRHFIPVSIVGGIAAILMLLVFGCGRKEKSPALPAETRSLHPSSFKPYDSSRIIIDSIRIDLNGDAVEEFVVTSRDATEAPNPVSPKEFDRIEIFILDTTKNRFSSVFVDPVESGMQISKRDLTGDGNPEIIVRTDAGGNDPIASQGMNIYGYRTDRTFTVLFFSQGGSPEIQDINKDAIPEIIVSGEYWGLMSHADVIGYTSAIHEFDGDAFIESNSVFERYFDHYTGMKKTEYLRARSARTKDPADYAATLYRACADWLVWSAAKGDLRQIKRIWEGEKSLLKTKLAPEQFEDLETLVQDSETIQEKPQAQRLS